MSVLTTVLGVVLIVLGAMLALASTVGFQRRERARAWSTVALAAVMILGGAVLIATS